MSNAKSLIEFLNKIEDIKQENAKYLVYFNKIQELACCDLIEELRNPSLLNAYEKACCASRLGKFEAIKSYRNRTGLGLKECKEVVENWMQKNLGFIHHPQ